MSADFGGLGALDAERAALTLPGTIPGLLRRCSPVRILSTHSDGFPGTRGVCTVVCRDGALVGTAWDHLWDAALTTLALDLTTLALDLTDATGRAHAAWWAKTAADELYGDQYRMSPDAARILRLAQSGAEMPAKLILDLRNLCLHVAGLEVTP